MNDNHLKWSHFCITVYLCAAVVNVWTFFAAGHDWNHLLIALLMCSMIGYQKSVDMWRSVSNCWRDTAKLWRELAEMKEG